MVMRWHLRQLLDERDLTFDLLAQRLSFALTEAHLAAHAPLEMGMGELAELCRALAVQPGELLSFSDETPAEQAERELANNRTYQSYLDFRASREDPDEP